MSLIYKLCNTFTFWVLFPWLFLMWQTLPPIRSSDQAESGSSVRPGRAEQRAQQQTGQERRRRPERPRPAVLHLGVTARSHSLMEYQTHFPTQFNTHYIDRYNRVHNFQIYNCFISTWR